ncbi:MAG: polysaccharide biosynthesis protein [Defluviitaleaceae bacterium]|nr:polysaccharide biosynthesis protein [Defluviitaleaceae bacterium]
MKRLENFYKELMGHTKELEKKNNHFVKQAAILAAASLLVRLIGFFYRIPLTRLVGDEGNAFYLSAYYVYAFAITLTSGALPAAISKLVSERIATGRYSDAHELFKTALGFAAAVGALVAFFMFFWADWLTNLRFFNFPEAAYSVRALAPTIFAVALLAVFRGYFQGMNTMVPTAISQVIEQILNAGFSLWLAHVFIRTTRVELAAAGAAAGTGIGVVAGLIVAGGCYLLVAKKIRVRAAGNRHTHSLAESGEKREDQIKALLLTAFPIIIGMGIYQIANFIDIGMARDRIMSSGFFTEDEVVEMVGQFTGKFLLLTTLPVALSVALSQAVIPDISSSRAVMDKGAVKEKINTAMRISMTLSIPAVVGLSVLADPILALLLPDHPEGGWLLRYGAVSIIFLALVQVSTGALQGIGKVLLPAIAAFFGVLIKIPVNWFLLAVPGINILGAVISTIVCYVVAAGINLVFLYKHTGVMPDYVRAFGKPAFASLGMGLVCFITHYMVGLIAPDRVATVLALGAGVPVYLVLMWMVGGFSHKDVDSAPLPKAWRKWLKS